MARQDHPFVILQRETHGRCPVIINEDGSYTLVSHEDVVAAATDPEIFSSAVSKYRALPNSLDGEEHRLYRSLVDSYMTPAEVAAQEPQCQGHARRLIAELPSGVAIDAVEELGTPFAVEAQCDWLGWPNTVQDDLVDWARANLDPDAFVNPDAFAPAVNMEKNLVFGAGPHFCPGRGLTLMELRVIIWELLTATEWIALDTSEPPIREAQPANEWLTVPLLLTR